MAITSTSSSSSSQIMSWNSPTLYLFLGLTLVLGLIAIALVVLACSYYYRKKHVPSTFGTELPVKTDDMLVIDVPKVVVIMAGDDKPTYLAMPVNIISQANDSTVHPLPPPDAGAGAGAGAGADAGAGAGAGADAQI